MYNNSSWICNVHHADKHIHKFLNDILVHFAVKYYLLLKSLNNQIKKNSLHIPNSKFPLE